LQNIIAAIILHPIITDRTSLKRNSKLKNKLKRRSEIFEL